jgi:hypothetical protein
MGKGIGKEVVVLVVAVIFGGVIIFILFKFVPNLINSILFALGVVKPNDLENAILCSIHRCADGCMSSRVKEITWKEGDRTVSCQEFCLPENIQVYQGAQCSCLTTPGPMPEFEMEKKVCSFNCKLKEGKDECASDEDCIPIELGRELKICDKSYPVNITIDKPQTVDISHLLLTGSSAPSIDGIGISDTNLFLLSASAIWQALFGWIKPGVDNIIIVESSLVMSRGESFGIPTLYKSVEIGSKTQKETVYISTMQIPLLLTVTHVWAVPTS